MKRTTIYIVFSVSIIFTFMLLVFKLDRDAVHDLEFKFNQQQAVQVDLTKRSIEDYFNWQVAHFNHVTDDLSTLIEQHYFYDMTGQRMLYSARSINQVTIETFEEHLSEMVAMAPQSEVMLWGIIGKSAPIFIPHDIADANNSLYTDQVLNWFKTHENEIQQSNSIFVTPIYASQTEQFVGVFQYTANQEGERQELMTAVIDLSSLIDKYVNPIRSGQFGAAWLQDFAGQVIFDHEQEIIGKNVVDLHVDYPEVLELDHRFSQELSGVAEYTFTVARNGDVKRKLVAWNTAQLGNQNLTVALSAPDSEISALLNGSRQTSLFLGVILTIFLMGSGGIFYYIQQTELRRLVKERTFELEKEQRHLQLEIADRIKAEDALRYSESNFRQLAENIRETFFLFDVGTHDMVYVSPAFETIWNHDINRVYHSPFWLLSTVYAEDKPLVRQYIREFWTNPDVQVLEFRIICGNGKVRWIRWRIFPYIVQGLLDRVICTAEDITMQKQMQATQISIEVERKRTQLLANFVQAAFHEFRTPLSIINTSVYLLSNIEDEKRRRDYLEFIRTESDNIMHLVEQLVTMSRLDIEEPFPTQSMHIDTLISNLQITMNPIIESAQLAITWDLQAESIYTNGDSEHLHLAFKNILNNAIKYSNAGDSITVKTYTQDDFICIDICDTGEGIDPSQLVHIFERFYRVDKAHSTRGFGLGLPIAQHIINRHGGTVTVQSVVGEGSQFHVMLPIAMINSRMSLEQEAS